MKSNKQHSALEVIRKEQLERRVFTVEFKAEVVRHKKAQNLSLTECGRKFYVLPKLIGQWEKQYDAGELTVTAGRRAVSPEQADITRLREELSRARMEVSIQKKSSGILCAGKPVKYAFILAELMAYPLSVVCWVLGVTQSGLQAWRKRPPVQARTRPG